MQKVDLPPARSPAASSLRQITRAARLLWSLRDFRVVVVCCVVLGLAASFVMPFLSLFATREVGMSLALFGAFMTVATSTNIGLSTFLSHRSDKLASRRPMLLWGSACGALGYFGYAVVRELWLLVPIAALVLGVASVTFAQLFAHARELLGRSEASPADAPLYMNVFRMSFAIAWTIGPALAAATLERFGFRGLFVAAGLLYALFFVIVLRFVSGAEPRGDGGGAVSVRTVALLLRPGVFVWFVGFVLIFAAHTISMSNMSLLVLNVLGGDESHVGVIFGLAPLFELPLMLYFGVLATRMDSARMIRGATALAVVYYGALSLVGAPWHVYPLQLLSAAIIAVTSGVAITFFQNKLPRQFGAATNLYANAVRLGSTSGYLVFGAIASRFGHRGAYAACAALVALALLLSLFDRERPVAL